MKAHYFENKNCWITGASSGIGESLAMELNRLGANLIVTARNSASLEKIREGSANPEKIKLLSYDLENIQGINELVRDAWNVYGGIDFVFLNAGFAVRDMIMNVELDLYRKVMDVNYFSSVAISKTLLPLMVEKGSGAFIVTSSLSGKYGVPKLSAYAASKHALHGYFESLRAEYANSGIQVTMVIPGLVKTNISVNALTGDGKTYGKMQTAVSNGISPEKCAYKIIQAAQKGKNEVLIGGSETFSVFLKRFFPGFWTWAIRNHPLKKLRKIGFGS